MVFRYYDGKVDDRYCLGTDCRGGFCHATMVNDDYTTEEILYDDTEYYDRRIGEPIVDCPKEVKILVREKAVLGKNGAYAQPGDIVEVVKGRKYPIGMKMAVANVRDGHFSNTYGRYVDTCLVFGSENGYETISLDNVRIIAIKGGSRNQEEYFDVHDLTFYKNGQEVMA